MNYHVAAAVTAIPCASVCRFERGVAHSGPPVALRESPIRPSLGADVAGVAVGAGTAKHLLSVLHGAAPVLDTLNASIGPSRHSLVLAAMLGYHRAAQLGYRTPSAARSTTAESSCARWACPPWVGFPVAARWYASQAVGRIRLRPAVLVLTSTLAVLGSPEGLKYSQCGRGGPQRIIALVGCTRARTHARTHAHKHTRARANSTHSTHSTHAHAHPAECNQCAARGQRAYQCVRLCSCTRTYSLRAPACRPRASTARCSAKRCAAAHICTGTGARHCHICTGTGAHHCHICTGTGAHHCHICTGTGARHCHIVTLLHRDWGSPLPHLRQDWDCKRASLASSATEHTVHVHRTRVHRAHLHARTVRFMRAHARAATNALVHMPTHRDQAVPRRASPPM